MTKSDEIKEELDQLIKTGSKLFVGLQSYRQDNDFYQTPSSDRDNFINFMNSYEQWYSKSLALVKQLLPDRYTDFVMLYKDEKRKDINGANYTISDAIQGIAITSRSINPSNALLKLKQQNDIIKACRDRFDTKIHNIRNVLQADLFDSEIDEARHLCSRGFLRAAGAICGVVIERHFFEVCTNHGVNLKKKEPTIADYNDGFKDVIYDTAEWRRIQRLGDIRNLCDHKKDREPTKEEVEELIAGVDKIIKTIF